MEETIERLVHTLHIHPAIVHFPVALFICALGFELLSRVFKKESFHTAARYLYVVAAVFAPVVAQTGHWEMDHLNLHHPVAETHEALGFATMWTALASLPILWFARKKSDTVFRALFLVFVLITAATVSIGAYYGGHMVYDYGVGIKQP